MRVMPHALRVSGFSGFAVSLVLVSQTLVPGIAQADELIPGDIAGVIVKFADGVDVASGNTDVPGETAVTGTDLTVQAPVAGDATLVLFAEPLSQDSAQMVASELESDPAVKWAEPDVLMFTAVNENTTPDDEQYASSQWNLWGRHGIGLSDGADAPASGWADGTGKGATVAVIDTGIASTPELDGQLVSGYDFVSNPESLAGSRDANAPPDATPAAFDGDYVDTNTYGELGRDSNPADPGDWNAQRASSWHGTKLAGIIAAKPNNAFGIVGIAPGVSVQSIRALSWRGGLLSDVAASITWAAGGSVEGAPANATPSDVINLSFTAQTTCPKTLQDAINVARERGAVVVAAAGNDSADAANYTPGNCNGVINVAATNRAGDLAGFSNYGDRIDIAAPGVNITSTSNTGTTTPAEPTTSIDDGTSLAAAQVSAAAAILTAENPDRGPKSIENQLTNRAQAPPTDACTAGCGAGILSLVEIASVASGDQDYAMSFNGSTQYATSGAISLSTNLTIEAWVNPGSSCASNQNVIIQEFGYSIYCTGGAWRFRYKTSAGAGWTDRATGVAVSSAQWQHIAVTRNSTTGLVSFYLNGQLAYSVTDASAWNASAAVVGVAAYAQNASPSELFNGQIDELRLYTSDRSASIATDMNTYGPTNTSGLAAYYDFNEGPAGTSGTGTVINRASGASSATNLRTLVSPTYTNVAQTASNGSNTVVTFPRSYLTAAGGWRAPAGVSTAKAIIIGGGGGGAGRHGGGGGAGGLVDRYTSGSVTVSAGAVYPIIVGQGGLGAIGSDNSPSSYDTSQSGQASAAFGQTADGGGKGVVQGSGVNGGSGGGKYTNSGSGGQPTGNGTGFAGGIGATNSSSYWAAGGGGGAGGAGGNASATAGGAAGAGLALSITGASITYARGGAGGFNGGSLSGAGVNGTANLGDGGGGAGSNTASVVGGQGGSGVVIVSYATSASGTCAPAQTQYNAGATTYKVVAFKSTGSCSWTVPSGVISVDYLVVAGGGGGGPDSGGGGGAGGLKTATAATVTPSTSATVVVGAGGAGGSGVMSGSGTQGSDGGASSLSGGGLASTISTVGGGGGGAGGTNAAGYNGRSGGSGGGSVVPNAGSYGTGTSGQGSNGGLANSSCSGNYCGGGGGGASAVGGNATTSMGGAGGAGKQSSTDFTWLPVNVANNLGIGEISASSVYFAGGGGGGAIGSATNGSGGLGGGGNGSNGQNASGGIGSTGGGGGGGGRISASSSLTSTGGSGGSGVVVLRYAIATDASTCTTSSAVDGANTVVSITGGSACTWQIPVGVASLDLLVVGGGGGGSADGGGGGGGGGVRSGASVVVSGGASATITVGTGGVGGVYGGAAAGAGTASTVSWSGKSYTANGGTGGSGWGSTNNAAAGSSSGDGTSSTSGAGGAGPGSCTVNVISQGTNGGNGTSSSITGSSVQYAGGGGGGSASNTIPMTFRGSAGDLATGSYGGGKGAAVAYGTVASVAGYYFTNGTAGALGGGGGAGSACGSSTYDAPTLGTRTTGGAGGNGIVIFRYATPTPVSNVCSPVSYTYSTNTVLEFQGSGSCNWTVPSGVSKVNALLVAGGGGGGSRIGGGGGAGELTSLTNQSVTAGSTQTIVVGAGGAGGVVTSGVGSVGSDGGDSSAFSVSVNGGGGGGYVGDGSASASAGGSGGGASCSGSAGSSSKTGSGSGNAGGAGSSATGRGCVAGGGGGAGAVGGAYSGQAGGDGGAGLASSITGTSVMYAGGGGGGINDGTNDLSTGDPGLGGSGGGGAAGAKTVNPDGRPGTDGLGAGGGGGSNGLGASANAPYAVGGDGGDGVVIVSYSNVPEAPTSVTGTASAVTTMDVAWTAPTYTGGSDITGYTIVKSAGGGSYTAVAEGTCAPATAATSTSTSCTVTGLTGGTGYTFKVTAINANGSGAQSTASSSTTAYGDLDHFAVTATDGLALGTQTAGTSFTVKITAQDSANTTVGNFTGTVVVTSTSLFSAGSGTTSAFTAGVLSSHTITLIKAGSSQTVTATRSSGGSQAGTSAAFTISAGNPTQLQVLLPGETAAPGTANGKTGTPTAQTAGTSFTATVNAVDANWNVVTSQTQTIAITSSDGNATLPSNAALSSGTQSFLVTLKTAGSATVTATVASGTSLTANTSSSVTVNAAAANTLVVSSIGQQSAGVGFPVTVTLTDTYGNVVNNSGAVGVVTLTRATGTGTLGGTLTGNIAIGSSAVTISGVTYSKAESGVSLTATGTGASSSVNAKTGTSGTFAVVNGAATSYAVTLSSTTPTVGGSVTVTAQLQDANGNAVATSGKTVTWSASGTGGSFSAATSTTNASGIATITYTVPQTAGVARTITATDDTSLTGTSSSLTTQVGALSAAGSTLTAAASSATADGTTTVVLTVQSKDQYGNNLTTGGATVTIVRDSGTGTVSTVNDNGNGTYTASVTTPTLVGSGVFSATIAGSTVQGGTGTAQTVTITYTAGAATKLVVSPVGTQAAGVAFGVTVTLTDANGNTVNNSGGTGTVTLTRATGTGTLGGTLSGTIANGSSAVTISGVTYTKAETGVSLTATGSVGGLVNGKSGTSGTFTVDPGAGSAYVVTLSSTNPAAGSAVTVTAQLQDSNGNNVLSANQTVTWSASSGGGSFATATSTTNASGVATVSYTTPTAAGRTRTITATTNSVTGTSASLTTTAGTAANIAVNAGNSQSATVDTTVATAPSVIVTDANANPVSGVSVSFIVATGGGTPSSAYVTTTDASGIATSSAWKLGTTAGVNTLTATSASLTGSPVTFTATGTAGSPAALDVFRAAAGAASGSAFTTQPKIRVKDAFGNFVSTDNATVVDATISTGGSLVGTLTATASNGEATFTSLGASGLIGNYTITYDASTTTSTTQSIAISTGPAAGLKVTTQPNGAAYGVALTTQPVVQVVDTGENPVSSSGRFVTATVTGGTASVADGTMVTDVSGVATFTSLAVTGTPGTYTLTFATSSLSSTTSATFTLAQAAQDDLEMSSANSAYYGQTITLAATGGSGSGGTTFQVGNGSASGCTNLNGVLSASSAGTCLVTATKAGDTNYLSVTSPQQTVNISNAGQVVSFNSTVPTQPLPNGTYTPAAAAVSTVTGSPTLVTPTITVAAGSSSICTMSNGVVTFTIAGDCVLEASAPSATNFNASGTVTQTIVVGAINQSITFTQPANVLYGSSSVAMDAQATSNLPVTYTLGAGTTSTACSVTALGVVTPLAVGTCEIVAAQSGSAAYAPASNETRAFQVLAAVATAPTITSASAADQSITVAFTAPGFDGGATISAYRLVATPVGGGASVSTSACSASASPLACTITGLANGTAYTVTASAINAAGTGPASAATGQLTPATTADAVGALIAIPGNGQLVVSWTPLNVAQLGGGNFQQYVVSYSVAGSGTWTAWSDAAFTIRTTSGTTITGLANSVSYDVKVVAITDANSTPMQGNTALVVEYPSTTPSAPLDVEVLVSTPTSVQVSWSTPVSDGGAPLTSPYYSVTVTSTSTGANSPVGCSFAQAGNRFCNVSGLTNGAVYTVSVTAQNRMGAGSAGTTTYVVPSSDSTLSGLVVSSGSDALTLSPAFATGTLTYSASVANTTEDVTVTPTTTTGGATTTVNGIAVTSGSASAPIALSVGTNTLTVVVTASDPSYQSTYVVAVVRAAAPAPEPTPPAPAPTPDWNTDPQTPPKPVEDGAAAGSGTVNGEPIGVNVAVKPNQGKTTITGDGFEFVARTYDPDGAVAKSSTPNQIDVPQGGWIVVRGDGYAANTRIAIYAIPATGKRVNGAILLGTATTDGGGQLNNRIMVEETFTTGEYVLQVNGAIPSGAIRSMDVAMKVTPTQFLMQRSAFYQPKSLKFSVAGTRKLNALTSQIPSWATNVKVTIVGVSVSLASGAENAQLAWKRGRTVSRALLDRGLHAKFTISTYITFERSVVAKNLKPATNPDGKPLTTVNITYRAP